MVILLAVSMRGMSVELLFCVFSQTIDLKWQNMKNEAASMMKKIEHLEVLKR